MYLGHPSEIPVKLYESSMYEYEGWEAIGIPAHGIENTDILLEVWKTGSYALEQHTVSPENWLEIGDGLYILKLDASFFTRVGNMLIMLKGNMIKDYQQSIFVQPAPLAFTPIPGMCIVTGNIVDLGGDSASDKIEFSVVQLPARVGESLVTSRMIISYSDAMGNFSVKLLRNSVVTIQIKSAGLSHRITVPDKANATLLELLPPIPY